MPFGYRTHDLHTIKARTTPQMWGPRPSSLASRGESATVWNPDQIGLAPRTYIQRSVLKHGLRNLPNQKRHLDLPCRDTKVSFLGWVSSIYSSTRFLRIFIPVPVPPRERWVSDGNMLLEPISNLFRIGFKLNLDSSSWRVRNSAL